MTYPFPLSEARYLDPPDDSHLPACEDLRWYECPNHYGYYIFNEKQGLAKSHKSASRNICPKCGSFSKRYEGCTCLLASRE